jgi:hypothetical protein
MSDQNPRRYGRAVPLPETFQTFEFHPTAHLSEEQKTWRVAKMVQDETFTSHVLADPDVPSPKLVVATRDTGLTDIVLNLLLEASAREQALGGSGIRIAGRESGNGTHTLTLLPNLADPGAEARLRTIADELNRWPWVRAEVRPAA